MNKAIIFALLCAALQGLASISFFFGKEYKQSILWGLWAAGSTVMALMK